MSDKRSINVLYIFVIISSIAAEANECEKNVGTTDKFVSNSTEKEADSSSLCYNR